MPKKFPVALPNASQRHNIFTLILRGTKVDSQNFDIDYLVRVSAGMSGSDIKEACRDAAMGPVREYIRRKKADGTLRGRKGVDEQDVRGLRTEDFFGRARAAEEMAKNLEDLDDVVVSVHEGARKIHTTTDEESSEGTESGEDAFGDPAEVGIPTTPVR